MTRYRLRTMVLARMLTEAVVLVGMMALPIVLTASGKLSSFKPPVQGMFIALGVIGLAILPWFGYITWLVTTDENGITSHALFKKQFCTWNQIKSLSRKASWNWLRFVVEYEGGELSFPVLLNKCDALVNEIRQHLPQGAGGGAAQNLQRKFIYDPIAMSMQTLQSLAAIAFVGLFWLFFSAKAHHFKPGSNDEICLLIFCAIATLIFLWRCWAVAFMPKSVEVTKSSLITSTYFNERQIPWTEVMSVGVPLPLLPEGFTIKTKKGTILIGSGMDSADELQQIVQFEIALVKNPNHGAAEAVLDEVDFEAVRKQMQELTEFSNQLLKSLSENGVDIEAAREIEYHFLSDGREAADLLAAHLAEQGCRSEVFAVEQGQKVVAEKFIIQAITLQTPAEAGLESNTAYLIGVADQHSCRYNGWDTATNESTG